MKSALFLRDTLGVALMEDVQKTAFAVYAILGKDKKFGPQDRMFRDLAWLASDKGMDFFVMVPGFSQTPSQEIEGYRLQIHSDSTHDEWAKMKVIWPQVVLRRMVHYPTSLKQLIFEEEERLERESLLITLPRRWGNKWRVFQQLQKDAYLRTFLPRTVIMKKSSEIFPFLESIEDLYVKPVLGSQGNRIMRIQKNENAVILASSQTEIKAFSSVDQIGLMQEVNERLSGQTAIVQETIDLLRTREGEPIDLRYLVQATSEQHHPKVTAIARVGKKSGITTNLHTGGQAFSTKKVAELLPSEQRLSWQRGVEEGKKVARKVFRLFQKEYPPLVELGVDLAIDQSGQVYFLEINPCPGRRMLRKVSRDWRIQSLERILNYASYLTTRKT